MGAHWGSKFRVLDSDFFLFAFDFILLVTVVLGSVADTAEKWLSGRTTPTNSGPVARRMMDPS